MSKLKKPLVAIMVGLALLGGTMVAQPAAPDAQSGATLPAEMPLPEGMPACHHHPHGLNPLAFAPKSICYLPAEQVFVLIDSIDCAVDVLQRTPDSVVRIGRFTTDVYKGRHDLKNILRPRSVDVIEGKVVILATAQKDSSFLAVFDLYDVMARDKSIKPIAKVPFNHNAHAFAFDAENHEIIVVGKNPVGYDIDLLNCEFGLEAISPATTYHYHVPKQAERIQSSDPHGMGLAMVAIAVVFFALVCICFIMKGYGSAIQKIQDRRSAASAPSAKSGSASADQATGEVYAAIAAAIYAYSQDMHDVEDTVITIQKVERAWTPWNAKFYNMNKYFSTRR